MKTTVALIAVAAYLSGCAAPGSPGSGHGSRYVPVIDPSSVNAARYPTDLAACQSLASSSVNEFGEALMAGLTGAALGAFTAQTVAPGYGLRTESANYGLAVGMGAGGGSAAARARMIVINCMAGRGYRTLDGGNIVVVQQAYQHAAASGQSAPVAQSMQPAAAGAEPVATKPATQPEAVGQESYQVERMPQAKACSPSPRAVLTNKGPGFETYTVMCANGDSLTVRCEFGACRVLR